MVSTPLSMFDYVNKGQTLVVVVFSGSDREISALFMPFNELSSNESL